MTREEIKALAAKLAEAGYTAKDLSGMKTFARGGSTDSDDTEVSAQKSPVDTVRLRELADRINLTSDADFVKRLQDRNRKVLSNGDGSISTHRLGYVTDANGNAIVFPEVQSNDFGLLNRYPYPFSLKRAIQRGDTLMMSAPDAELFTNDNYKLMYPMDSSFAAGGFIRRFGDGSPGTVIPVGDPRLLAGTSGVPTVHRVVPYDVSAPMAVENIPTSVEELPIPSPTSPVISDDERRRRIATLQSRGLEGVEDSGYIRQMPVDASAVQSGVPDRSMNLDLNDEVHIPDRNASEYFRDATKKLYAESFPNLESLKGDDLKSMQQSMVDSGYYERYLRSLSKDGIKKEQARLVNRGLLSDERRSDGSYKEVDGIAGKKTIEAFNKSSVDGILGKRTKQAYEYKKQTEMRPGKNADLQFDKVAKGTADKCARYVRDIFRVNGADTEASGISGNAWTMPMTIAKHGGEVLFNIYDNKSFSGVKTVSQLKATTRQELHNSNFNLRTLQVGDVVGIYFPDSRHHADVLKSGSTYNTHIGLVRSIDRDGMPVIDHFVGRRRVDRADRLYGGGSITVAVRPDFGRSSVPEYKFVNKPSTITLDMPEKFEKLSTPESKQKLSLYMESLEGAKAPIGKIYKDADMDNVQRIAVSILGRETGFMQNIASNQTSLRSKASNAAREAAHTVMRTNPGAISSELTKFKLNSLTIDERQWLGIQSPDDLESPEKAARAVELLLAKNYDYFVRYAKANPSLNLTEQDIIDLTAASYNVGMRNLFNIGSTKIDNRYIQDQARLDKFRAGAASEEPVDDINSTNLGRLARLPFIGTGAQLLYNFGVGTRSNSYTNSNRQYMGLIRPVESER